MKSTRTTMRLLHRYIGYFMAGIMAVYAISGVLLIYRDTDFLKKEKEIEDMVALAIQEGRITADKKQTFVELAVSKFELAKSTLESFPKKNDLSAGIITPAGTAGEIMTDEKFQTLDTSAQLAWKESNPEEYKKLFS